ncbi:hemerythrin domain-containing protein [Bacillus andreraoultii]|uniref:hemerythrin domain-containing protein n=1 Tax=Bacillus andreraoultii TaxID=1499685 RepID=UPI000539D277|nr:hemerythrin domain-containing protein [Bacillus andreraoultii]
MSGPGLKHVDSHSAIHEAALEEAKELNEIIAKLIRDGQLEKAHQTALVAIEHWETRTLRHAQAEEEGLYQELVEESPELKNSIIELTRDHNTMRYFVKQIKTQLESDGFNEEILHQLYALVHVDTYHNFEEERILPHH